MHLGSQRQFDKFMIPHSAPSTGTNTDSKNLWLRRRRAIELLADGAAFEVEFSDRNGRTYESVGLHPEQIMVLYFGPALPNIKLEMVTA